MDENLACRVDKICKWVLQSDGEELIFLVKMRWHIQKFFLYERRSKDFVLAWCLMWRRLWKLPAFVCFCKKKQAVVAWGYLETTEKGKFTIHVCLGTYRIGNWRLWLPFSEEIWNYGLERIERVISNGRLLRVGFLYEVML